MGISLAVVNDWFTVCKLFANLGRELRYSSHHTRFDDSFRTTFMLGNEFGNFYKRLTNLGEEAHPGISVAVQPFELPVKNFMNLAVAERFHAMNSWDFPRRQNGTAIPSLDTSVSAVTYTRQYSPGVPNTDFSQTCRFCCKDGEEEVHYGCWEEEAISFERCVSVGGIYYASSIPNSIEYSCLQYQSFKEIDLTGTWSIEQKSTSTFLDAKNKNRRRRNHYRMVTRLPTNAARQKWKLDRVGEFLYTVQQKGTMRFMDAENHRVVTRNRQNNPSQQWKFVRVPGKLHTYNMQQGGNFLSAKMTGGDVSMITEDASGKAEQEWILIWQGDPDAEPGLCGGRPQQADETNNFVCRQQ